jgi:tetratricopeptide (TPR) repeat protein
MREQMSSKDEIIAELTSAQGAESRERDRICQKVAKELFDAGQEPDFDVDSDDFGTDPLLIAADQYWKLRFLATPSVRTAALCARWLAAHAVGAHRVAIEEKWALGYAFITRDTVESWAELDEASRDILGNQYDSYFATLYHAGKLRANFTFSQLDKSLESLLGQAAGIYRDNPLFIALQSFAAFGSAKITNDHALSLFNKAWSVPERSRAVADICLNGLWAAGPFDAQGTLLRDHAQEALAHYPGDHIFLFRLARGQRLAEDYQEALTSIDSALELLPAVGGRGSHELLQNQYMDERHAIIDSLIAARKEAAADRKYQQQLAQLEELRHDLKSSTVRASELVAVFAAAIAFAFTSTQITLNGTLSAGGRAWLIAEQGIGLTVFALLVVGGTWFITRQKK